MAIVNVTERGCRCDRCGHEWIPHDINRLPKVCPKCISAYWNTPRRKQQVRGSSGSRGSSVKQPQRRTTPGRGGSFNTGARTRTPVRRQVPKRPTQREIDRAGIGGAT
jgi:hypothetical protein